MVDLRKQISVTMSYGNTRSRLQYSYCRVTFLLQSQFVVIKITTPVNYFFTFSSMMGSKEWFVVFRNGVQKITNRNLNYQ